MGDTGFKMIKEAYKIITLYTDQWHVLPEFAPWPGISDSSELSALHLTARLHYHNLTIWHHEDYARSGDAATIVRSKQNIDKHNQLRNNTIDDIDVFVLSESVAPKRYARHTTDSIGSIVDRISVAYLKIYHGVEKLREIYNKPEFAELDKQLTIRHSKLKRQCSYLMHHGDILYAAVKSGRCIMLASQQFKMYNDPSLNRHHQDNHEHRTDPAS